LDRVFARVGGGDGALDGASDEALDEACDPGIVCSYFLHLLLSLLRVPNLFLDIALVKLGRGEGGAEVSSGSGVNTVMVVGVELGSSTHRSHMRL